MTNIRHLPKDDEQAALEDIRSGNAKLRLQFILFIVFMLVVGLGGTAMFMHLADKVAL